MALRQAGVSVASWRSSMLVTRAELYQAIGLANYETLDAAIVATIVAEWGAARAQCVLTSEINGVAGGTSA